MEIGAFLLSKVIIALLVIILICLVLWFLSRYVFNHSPVPKFRPEYSDEMNECIRSIADDYYAYKDYSSRAQRAIFVKNSKEFRGIDCVTNAEIENWQLRAKGHKACYKDALDRFERMKLNLKK